MSDFRLHPKTGRHYQLRAGGDYIMHIVAELPTIYGVNADHLFIGVLYGRAQMQGIHYYKADGSLYSSNEDKVMDLLRDITPDPVSKQGECVCEIRSLMTLGCKCGGFQASKKA